MARRSGLKGSGVWVGVSWLALAEGGVGVIGMISTVPTLIKLGITVGLAALSASSEMPYLNATPNMSSFSVTV